jgi:hypothetical protein
MTNIFSETAGVFTQPIQQFVFYDKYSRFNYDKGRREGWPEVVERVTEHLKWLSKGLLSDDEYRGIYDAIYSGQVAPSMRLMRTAGEAAQRIDLLGYNCAYTPINCIDAIVELFWLSMCGVGVGYSVEQRYVDELPEIGKKKRSKKLSHVIEDSAEGWRDAFRLGLETWWQGKDVKFDYSQIRPAGSPLRTKGGTSSGPQVLQDLIDYSRGLILGKSGDKLSTVDVFDLCTSIGSCAVSGGSRRSAQICLFDKDDDLMLSAKSNGFWKTHPNRANANISVAVDSELDRDEFEKIIRRMIENETGEPGIFSRYAVHNTKPTWRRDMPEAGTNPCHPDDTIITTVEYGRVPIKELINKQFTALVSGKKHQSTESGFFLSHKDRQDVYRIVEEGGRFIEATPNHRFLVKKNRQPSQWVELSHVIIGDEIATHDHAGNTVLFSKVAKIKYVGKKYVYDCQIPGINAYDANGFYSHNCGEVALNPVSESGKYGGQLCNLSTAHVRESDNLKSLIEKVKWATVIGTIQSMADGLPGLRPAWREIQKEQRLLGVSLIGSTDNPSVALNQDTVRYLRDYATKVNIDYAKKLGINRAAAVTCVKPAGNSSVLYDTARGINARYAEHYIRRVRLNTNSPMYKVFKQSGYPVKDIGNNMAVASFYVKSPDGALIIKNLSALQQLENWRLYKTKYTHHNPSVTIEYEPDEVDDIVNWLYDNQSIISGLAFLPKLDMVYKDAPYEEITEKEYKKAIKGLPEIDFSLLETIEAEDNMAYDLECAGGVCDLT